MSLKVDPTACEKTPGAVHAALARRVDWQRGFEEDFLKAAGDFDQPAMDAAVERWFPAACACATPGYVDQVEGDVRRAYAGELVFRDAEGNGFDVGNNPVPRVG